MPPGDGAIELQHPDFVKLDVAGVELEERADSLQERSRIGPMRLGTVGKLAEPRSLDGTGAPNDGGQSLASMRRTRSARAWRTAVLTVGKSSIS